MVEEDKRDFASVLRATLDVYGKEASPDVLRIWWAALQDRSIDEVRIGFSRYIRSTDSGTFPPKPADIIRMIDGTSADRGMQAWAKVLEAIQRVGGYRSLAFDDPIIHVVIEAMGGWSGLCVTPKDEMQFRAAEFAKRYRGYAEIGGVETFPAYLVGRSEAQNNLNGFKSEAPVLIGNAEAAAKVVALGSASPRLQITSGKAASDLAQSVVKAIELKKLSD